MPGSQTLLLLSLFSRDFCLSLMFMPILVTSHPPRWPRCVSRSLPSVTSEAGGFLLTVITSLRAQEPPILLVPLNFLSLCPIPLCPFVLLARRRPDRGQMVSSSPGAGLCQTPRRKDAPWRRLCRFLLDLKRCSAPTSWHSVGPENNLSHRWRRALQKSFLEIQRTPICVAGSCGW